MAAELVWPAIPTRVPGNKNCHLLSADRGKQIQTGEYLTPMHGDSFCGILGWAQEMSWKSE